MSPVDVRFMFSDWDRAVASECIIDVEEVSGLAITSTDGTFTDTAVNADASADRDDQHVAPDTVEILITNLPPQRRKPVPWSVHYQWLFRAAGYDPAPVDLLRLVAFESAARSYAQIRSKINPGAPAVDAFDFDAEDLPLLTGPDVFPFPYLDMSPGSSGGNGSGMLAELSTPAADPWNRPLCPQGGE